ncbi:MAG: FAD-binding protein [Alphaproteobacteria bacterium]|nr:FAD-binding protein [Alphaproteobacteria bacterium]
MAALNPADAHEVRAIVGEAMAAGATLAVEGGGSKRGLGRPVAATHTLSLVRLDGIIDYAPSELVLTARAGTALSVIEALLAQHGQHLAFEPPDTSAQLGPGAPTLGGLVACNLAGPRRLRAGACRDHVLGIEAVTGFAEIVKAGGKVVKNVTGYDLPKLFAGSFGTLGVMTAITMKVLPRPEKTRTVLVFGLDGAAAGSLMIELARGPLDVSALAYVPRAVAARSAVGYVAGAGSSVLAARLEGPPRSVLARTEAARARLGAHAPVEELHGHNSAALWREIGFGALLAAPASRPVWRLGVPPADGAAALRALEQAGAEGYLDAAGGTLWAAAEEPVPVHDLAARHGGTAMLVRAPAEARARMPVFAPQAPALAALERRVKQAFDPKGVFEPGRRVEGV